VLQLLEQIKLLTKLVVNENDLSDSVDSESASLELHFKSPRVRRCMLCCQSVLTAFSSRGC
jgi:hypothetical protein